MGINQSIVYERYWKSCWHDYQIQLVKPFRQLAIIQKLWTFSQKRYTDNWLFFETPGQFALCGEANIHYPIKQISKIRERPIHSMDNKIYTLEKINKCETFFKPISAICKLVLFISFEIPMKNEDNERSVGHFEMSLMRLTFQNLLGRAFQK